MKRAVALEHRQGTAVAGLSLSGCDAVWVEPGFGTGHQLADVGEGHPRCPADEETLGLFDPSRPHLESDPLEQADDERGGRDGDLPCGERRRQRRIPRGQDLTQQIRPRRRCLPHRDESFGVAGRPTRVRGDHRRSTPVSMLLREPVRAEFRPRLVRDRRRELGVEPVEASLRLAHRTMRVEQLDARELRRLLGVTPDVAEALEGLEKRHQAG